jgi:hypothetical protein
MELSQILNSLSGGSEKTASDNTQSKSSRSLESALDRALNSPMSKTASVRGNSGPVEDLTKIASRLATAEQEALIKEAELYGAAVCDGFMSRMNDYDTSSIKTAGYYGEDDFEKFASHNPDLARHAMELGYRETKAELEKIAQVAYTQGYSDTMQGFSKEASYEKIAAEKIAAHVKVAAEKYAGLGYKVGMRILADLGR